MGGTNEHTPGPWLVQWEQDGNYVVWTREGGVAELALVRAVDDDRSLPAKQNATLMAAAPDLRRALRACREELFWCAKQLAERGLKGRPDGSVAVALQDADSALAKARGEA